MKHIFGIFLALFVVSGAYATSGTVLEVVDGDTIVVVIPSDTENDVVQKVQFANANAPEFPATCSAVKQIAQQAQDRAKALMPQGTTVELKNIKENDKYKYVEANVVLPDGRDVGEILIKEKLAKSYDGKNHEPWCKKKVGVPGSSVQKKPKSK